ncbi:MAG: hypothetical protein KatS3mg077_0579 [Candidatus Binatia bacterium]|nr:MAG: hypothetical protein KatS3mg077_0579 [Candidatus Binatia bacterium]
MCWAWSVGLRTFAAALCASAAMEAETEYADSVLLQAGSAPVLAVRKPSPLLLRVARHGLDLAVGEFLGVR